MIRLAVIIEWAYLILYHASMRYPLSHCPNTRESILVIEYNILYYLKDLEYTITISTLKLGNKKCRSLYII